jgi:hypothetical protein
MSPFLFFAMAAEHRLDYLDYLAPGVKAVLLQEFGPAGGASLMELGGEALEASMQRAVEHLRKAGSLAKAMSRDIAPTNVRPHPYRPVDGEGLGGMRRAFAEKTCPGTSADVLDSIYKTRTQFDQGCSSPIPLGFLTIVTPACYGHDICCECGRVRTHCDKPFGDAMVGECFRKLGGWFEFFPKAACVAQSRLMALATYAWGLIAGGSQLFPPHCSNACAQDMMAYKNSPPDLDPWFRR